MSKRIFSYEKILVSFIALFMAQIATGTGYGNEAITVNGVSFWMSYIPEGEFIMGSDEKNNEGPKHLVKINPFQIGETEVTQGLWTAVMGNNPSFFKNCGVDCPVERVSWNDVQEFLEKLNRLVEGGGFRLPTESEWAYACRAGSNDRFFFVHDGDRYEEYKEYAWCHNNSRGVTHPVGWKNSNPWGLYDVYGNVWEWCQDWYGQYPSGSVIDPEGAPSGLYKATRGGSFNCISSYVRSTNRESRAPRIKSGHMGFRLARDY